MATDAVIDDILDGVVVVRQGIPILEEYNPAAAAIASGGLTLLYEGLVLVRTWRGASVEKLRAELAARCEKFIQELAAVRFGKKEP